MEFTQEQLDNATGHFQAAKGLVPYREVIEKIANNRDYLKSIIEITYEEAITRNPEISEIPRKHYDLCKEFVSLFTSDDSAAPAYLYMIEILEKK